MTTLKIKVAEKRKMVLTITGIGNGIRRLYIPHGQEVQAA
jgi:hypothetical protein